MNLNRQVVFASLLAIGMAGGASAATVSKTPATSQRCDELITQFDAAKASHATAKHYDKAVAARESGGTECKAGQYQKGVTDLSAALHDIGVKPLAHNKS